MNGRRRMLAGTVYSFIGLITGCLDTFSGGRFSGGIDQSERTARQGELVEIYDDATSERNDGITSRNEGIQAFNDEEYEKAIDRFEPAIEHFEAARDGFSEAASIAYDIGEDEAGSICETAEADARLQIAATEASLAAATTASNAGAPADVNEHVEEYRDRLDEAEEYEIVEPQTLADTLQSE